MHTEQLVWYYTTLQKICVDLKSWINMFCLSSLMALYMDMTIFFQYSLPSASLWFAVYLPWPVC